MTFDPTVITLDLNSAVALVSGVTSGSIVSALGYTPLDVNVFNWNNLNVPNIIKNFAALTPASDQVVYSLGSNLWSTTAFTPVGRTLVGQSTTGTMLTNGLGFTTDAATLIGETVSGMKVQLGLDQVENKNGTGILAEMTGSQVTTALGYTP